MKNLTTVFNLLLFPFLLLGRFSLFQNSSINLPHRHLEQDRASLRKWLSSFFFFFFLLLSPQYLLADSTQTDNFGIDLNGWSGDISSRWYDGSRQMQIDPSGTTVKTYTFGAAYINATTTISFDLTLNDEWEDSGSAQDYIYVYINGNLEATYSHSSNYSGTKTITTGSANGSGDVELKIVTQNTADNEYAYVDNVSVMVQSPPLGGECSGAPGLTGDYYNNINFTDPVSMSRVDSTINFAWEGGNPGGGINNDNFSIEWTGFIFVPENATYTFDLAHDDVFTLIIDGNTIYNSSSWTGGSNNYRAATPVSLTQGHHPITLRFVEWGGGAYAKLAWHNNASIGSQTIIPSNYLCLTDTPMVANAIDDSYITVTNNSISENVLTNDSGAGISVTSNTNPSHGAVTFQATGGFTYTPNSGYTGNDTFTYTITDTALPANTSTATVTIDIVNPDAVNAVNDSYSAFTDTALSGNVLTNDTGTALSVTSHTNPANGTLTITMFGDFEYRSNAGFTGTDTFTYTATDIITASDTATVTITVSNDTNYTDGSEHTFELINPPFTRNLVGNYNIAGNTVMCLTDHYSTYGGTCQDAGMEYETSNRRISKYIDIDGDSSTWNSTSSYIDFPDTFDRDNGQRVKWAGLFWQGRLSADNDYPIHFGVVDGNAYNFSEIGKDSSYDPDIENTDANRIKLKVDTSNYNDIQASNVFTYDSSGGTTYAAFADVTSVLQAGNLSHGKHTFTVANLTTGEGREASPGVFGGWSLVVIYNENADGKLRNISIYNGFVSIDTSNDPIEISGFKLPTDVDEDVNSQMAVFSGEGEYRYGRTPSSTTTDYMKISNLSDSGWLDMPGATNPNNIFDAILDGVTRDNITGHSNNLQVNNDGVDIDNFDVTSIMTPYRNANPDMSSIFISLYSNNDYITPSMVAFSAELYKPNVCYDYVVKRDDYTIPSEGLEINATFKKGERLSITAAIKSLESDVDLELSAVGIDMRQREGIVSFDPTDAYYSLSNANTLLPTVVTNNSSQARPEIAIGKNRNALIGGTIGPFERYYAKFNYDVIDVNGSKFVADFNIELNTTIDYGSGPITQILPLKQCEQSAVYNPDWLEFNVERDFSTAPSNDTERYSLYTQIAGQDFDYSVAAYTQDANNRFTVETSVNDMTVDIELIDAEAFDDNTSFLKCSNPEPSIILGGFGNSTFVHFNNESREYVRINDFSNTRAVKNTVFRMWILADVNNTIIPHLNTRTDGDKFKIIYDDNYAILDTAMMCADDCGVNGIAGSSTCYDCLRNNFAKPICSRDNFTIRPESYRISLSDIGADGEATTPIEVTQNNSSMTNQSLAAGYDYNLTGQSTKSNGSTSNGYYNTENFSTATLNTLPSPNEYEDIAVLQFTGPTTACQDQNHTTLNVDFTNGILDEFTLAHNNVGDYALWIEDNSWTKVDQASHNPFKTIFDDNCRVDADTAAPAYCNDCILGNNTSGGADTKPGCTIDSSLTANIDYEEIDLNFNPYQFNLDDITFHTRPHDPNSYLYMNDLNKTDTMAVKMEGNITAEGKNGTTLSNFTSGCAAEDVVLWLDRTMTPLESNILAEDNTTRVYFQQGLKDITNALTVQNNEVSNDINSTLTSANFAGTLDNNGSAIVDLYFNFQKPYSELVNPIDVNFSILNAASPNDISNANLQSDYIPDGNTSINQNRYFYFARVAASQGTDGVIEYDPSITTTLRVNSYCRDDISITCSGLPGFPITPEEIFSGAGWYRMQGHLSSLGDGQVSLLNTTVPNVTISPSSNVTFDSNGSTSIITISYPMLNRPVHPIIVITPDEWLRYNEDATKNGLPQFVIHFLNQGLKWKGKGQTGHVVETEPSVKSSGRLNW